MNVKSLQLELQKSNFLVRSSIKIQHFCNIVHFLDICPNTQDNDEKHVNSVWISLLQFYIENQFDNSLTIRSTLNIVGDAVKSPPTTHVAPSIIFAGLKFQQSNF